MKEDNMGDDCATGVAFTRDPSTGENAFYGEYLVNAQGEDVVAGIRTPQHLTIAGKDSNGSEMPSMEEIMPEVFGQLMEVRSNLEGHFRDVQDIEFTVQNGKLWMLQTRSGKRTAKAALRIACDMVDEGLITEAEAVARIDPESLDQLLHPTLDPAAERHVVARGLPASPGAASGKIVFSADEAERMVGQGEDVILVRIETSPEDIHGMHAANGILTSRGGMTSHAAVVARGMGTPCVAGAGELRIDYATQCLTAREETLKAGDVITTDQKDASRRGSDCWPPPRMTFERRCSKSSCSSRVSRSTGARRSAILRIVTTVDSTCGRVLITTRSGAPRLLWNQLAMICAARCRSPLSKISSMPSSSHTMRPLPARCRNALSFRP